MDVGLLEANIKGVRVVIDQATALNKDVEAVRSLLKNNEKKIWRGSKNKDLRTSVGDLQFKSGQIQTTLVNVRNNLQELQRKLEAAEEEAKEAGTGPPPPAPRPVRPQEEEITPGEEEEIMGLVSSEIADSASFGAALDKLGEWSQDPEKKTAWALLGQADTLQTLVTRIREWIDVTRKLGGNESFKQAGVSAGARTAISNNIDRLQLSATDKLVDGLKKLQSEVREGGDVASAARRRIVFLSLFVLAKLAFPNESLSGDINKPSWKSFDAEPIVQFDAFMQSLGIDASGVEGLAREDQFFSLLPSAARTGASSAYTYTTREELYAAFNRNVDNISDLLNLEADDRVGPDYVKGVLGELGGARATLGNTDPKLLGEEEIRDNIVRIIGQIEDVVSQINSLQENGSVVDALRGMRTLVSSAGTTGLAL